MFYGIFECFTAFFDQGQKDAPWKMLHTNGSLLGRLRPGSCSFTAFCAASAGATRVFGRGGRMCVWTYVYVCVCVCMCVWMYVCVYVRMCVYVCVCGM